MKYRKYLPRMKVSSTCESLFVPSILPLKMRKICHINVDREINKQTRREPVHIAVDFINLRDRKRNDCRSGCTRR